MSSDYDIQAIKEFLDEYKDDGNMINCEERQQEVADIIASIGLKMGDWYAHGEASKYRYMYYAPDIDEIHMCCFNNEDRHTVTIEELLRIFHKEDEVEDEPVDIDLSILLFG